MKDLRNFEMLGIHSGFHLSFNQNLLTQIQILLFFVIYFLISLVLQFKINQLKHFTKWAQDFAIFVLSFLFGTVFILYFQSSLNEFL